MIVRGLAARRSTCVARHVSAELMMLHWTAHCPSERACVSPDVTSSVHTLYLIKTKPEKARGKKKTAQTHVRLSWRWGGHAHVVCKGGKVDGVEHQLQ